MNSIIDIKKFFVWFLLSICALTSYAQSGTIDGKVSTPSGTLLENVKIYIQEHPQTEVYTNEAGEFSIEAEEGQHIVLEYNNNAKKVYSFAQLQDNQNLTLDRGSELVQTGFRNVVRSEELASSIGFVNTNNMINVTAHTPGELLYGQIPGLRAFQNTGPHPNMRQPGLDIRGVATMQNQELLVLIDGVERSLNSVVPEEIESFSVLRDAAAKARYGQRGANGVLIVNTKRGNKGPTRYIASYERGVTQPTHLPEFLSAANYARSVNQALANDLVAPRFSQEDIARYESGDYPTLYPDVDWLDETLVDRGQFTRMNFSATGGSEEINFFMILNYQTEEGLYKNTEAFDRFSTQLDYDKVNFRTNLDVQLTPSTEAMVNLAGYIRSNQGPDTWNILPDAYSIPASTFPVKNYDGTWGGDNQFNVNPVAEIMSTGYSMTHTRSMLVDISLKQDLNYLVDGLNVEVFAAYDNTANFFENKTRPYLFRSINPVLDDMGAIVDTVVTDLGEDGDLNPDREAGNVQTTHYDVRGKLNFTRTFGIHSIDSWLMFQQEQFDFNDNNTTFRHRNFVGNVHYGLMGKYFLDATVSYYGTNRIQEEGSRYGIFPAVAGAWLISKENFMADVKPVNFLKLSASFGQVGNGRIPIENMTDPRYGFVGDAYVFGDNYNATSGQEEKNIPIDQKKWETSTEANIGLETRLFDKLDVQASWFYQKRSDIFVSSLGQYSFMIGILPEQVPQGIVENKGYELGLTWSDEVGDFNYFISGMFSQYRNEIVEMNEIFRPYDYMRREGNSIGQFYGWESDGFYADENEINNSPTSQFGSVRPGDIKYVDQNDDNIIDEFDIKAIGNTVIPQIYYSTSLGVGYKGFQLTALFQGTGRSSAFLNQPHVFWPLQNNTGNISTWYDDYWTPNNQDAALPRLTTEANNNNFRRNDVWIRDNSFIKLRYAEFSYVFPADFLNNFGVNQLRLYVRGRNLFTMDNINYVDPENTTANYPVLRMFNLGANVTF